MEVVKRLREQGQLSMEQTCQQVGYNDLSTFRSLFKRKTGVSSGDYQKRFRQVLAAPGEGAEGLIPTVIFNRIESCTLRKSPRRAYLPSLTAHRVGG
ncbi:MAG: helix-turn-helix domain-containing protein [Pseudomonas piscis]|uniref:helix-turn-helix domain-containing protein n=1 Tax=Pseudomonas piscis TaxID=2614538 RepID=UPI003D27B5EA